MSVLLAIVFFLLQLTNAKDDVIFATITEDQDLATRLNCRVEEAEHFEYRSEVRLWGEEGGKMMIDAHILLHCLGADMEGKYGSDALKYNVIISRLTMNQEATSSSVPREKRGVKEFVTNSWKKVKQFFNKMMGRRTEEPRFKQDGDVVDEEPEEVFSYESLYSVPFQIVQLANGTIPELRFSENEVEDGRVRNFKRHLADAFSTQLSQSATVLESTVIGEHTATYNITRSEEKSNLNVAGWSGGERGTVVVKKRVTEEDIVKLAPSEALNDRDKIDLKSHQTQVFRNGRMVSSSGSSSFNVLTEDTKMRNRRAATPDEPLFNVRAHTTFNIQLRRRRRRSIEESVLFQKDSFRPVSRVAENEDESEKKRQLLQLHKTVNFSIVFDNMLKDKESVDEDFVQNMSEILEKEARLKLSEVKNSLSSTVRNIFTLEKIKDICSRDFTNCRSYLHLLALAGGSEVEKVFLLFLKEVDSTHILPICDILNDLPRPSAELLRGIEDILFQQEQHELQGALSICVSNLAAKSGEEESAVDLLLRLLEDRRGCGSLLIDLLEATGNLRSNRTVPRVMQVSEECAGETAVQIACVHAVRHSAHHSDVQHWMERVVRKGDCDVIDEVVGELLTQVKEPDEEPHFHLNAIDTVIEKLVADGKCSSKAILRYFHRKKSDPTRKKRRAFWDDVNCDEWTEDSHYTPVQGRDEFAADRAIYNRRKSCLAFRKIGLKGANAEIYAGMFAGVKEPSDPPKYKLFTKFVTGLNVLDYQTEVGSFYFYLHSGKTKAYVRVMGQTRQELSNEGCTPSELHYRPLKHIPLYMVSIANLQLSLGIQLSSRLSLDTLCPADGVFTLQPLTNIRMAGEAVGTALFMRGAASLGANFNYKLQFTFTPSPNMCLNGSHGYDPMNINFESYFQLWNSAKEDWGKMRSWKPNLMFWRMRDGQMKQWFKETCISTEEMSSEREVE